jgi:hypothetical protein
VDGNGLEQEIVAEGQGEPAKLPGLLKCRHQQSLGGETRQLLQWVRLKTNIKTKTKKAFQLQFDKKLACLPRSLGCSNYSFQIKKKDEKVVYRNVPVGTATRF